MADALIIQVDSSQVEKGKRSLADLASQGAKTETAIGGLGKTGKKVGDGLAEIGRGAGLAKAALATIAGFSLVSIVKDVTLLATRYDELGIVMRVVGRNAGITTVELEAQELALRKTGISMLESRANITKLIAANIDLAKSTDLARIAQDAAVIGGVNSSEAFASLVTGIQTAQVETLRTLGLNVSFEASYTKLAATLGKTSKDLTEYEKTQARVNAVLALAPNITGAYEASLDNAGKQVRSSTRYIEDFKVKLGETFNEALIVAVSGFTSSIKDANGKVDELAASGQLKQWGDGIVDTMAFVADAVASVGTVFRLTGSHIAEFFAIRSTLNGFLGGKDAIGIRAAAQEDRAQISKTASAFRDALTERRAALAETSKNKDPELERLLADDAAFENDKRRIAESKAQAAANSTKGLRTAESLRKKREATENAIYALEKELNDNISEREFKHLKAVKETTDKNNKLKEENANKFYALEKELSDIITDREFKHLKRVREIKEETAKDQLKAQQELAKDINKSLTDALLRGFESGKGFAKNFRDTLINMFKTLVLQPNISAILNPLTDGVSGILSGGTGKLLGGGTSATGGGIFGSASNLLSVGKSIYSGFSSSLSSNIGGLVAKLAPKLGSSIAGSMLGSAAGLGPTVAGSATGIGSLAGSVGSLGSAISTALPYIGLAIGALSLIKSLTKKNSYQNGNFTSSFQDGALTQTGAATNSRGALATGALPAINEVTETFAARLSFLFNEFGLSNKQIFRTQIKFGKQLEASFGSASQAGGGAAVDGYGGNNYGSDAQAGMARFVSDILGKGLQGAITTSSLSGGIKKFFTSLTKQEDVLDAITSIVALNQQLGNLPKVFNAIRNAIDTTSYETSIADLKSRFAAIGTYTSLFYTAEEQFATFTKQLNSQLSALGTGLPSSRDEYRKLVDGINVTDEATSGLFNGLVALAPAMDAYFKQLEEQQAQVNALAKSMDSLRTEQFFKTLFDFKRYTGVADNYGSDFANNYVDKIYTSRKLPSFATGADMLPNDMVAQVHAGERIVPAADNKAIIQALNGGGDLKQLIRDLIIEVRSGNISMVQAAQKTAKVMQRIDDEGVMINETNNAGVRTVLNVRTVA